VDADDAEGFAAAVGRQVQRGVVVVQQVEPAEPVHQFGGGASAQAERAGQAFERGGRWRTRRPRYV
jgi:hypothetical protein